MFNTLCFVIFCVGVRLNNLYTSPKVSQYTSPKVSQYTSPKVSKYTSPKVSKYYRVSSKTLLPDSFFCKSSFQCENYCCVIFYKSNHPLSTGYCCKNGRLAIENFYTSDSL